MDTIRGMIDKVSNKSKTNDEHSRSGPDTSSAYRSSDAGGEPDVGTKSYSRDTGVSRDDWDDRRKDDSSSSYSSHADGGGRYSTGSSAAVSGLGAERSLSGNSGRDYKSHSSTMSGEENPSTTTATDSDSYFGSARHNSSKEHLRSSDNDDNGQYSKYSSRTAEANAGDDEIDEMNDVHGRRGTYGHSIR
ncbi:unnamed protein product [Peronospora belbahrii]|uniref:Uncharacterized protein n=1 Tax=Peronospora belbahrii TaxID=622444 RepID=A0AAU9L8C3_9STRA|nr:unnamed protein product [Peronospora belbahrii]CAH0515373.1 unnamed protein product [Peronospora belbahrii]